MKRSSLQVAFLLVLSVFLYGSDAHAVGTVSVVCDRAQAKCGETITWQISFEGWDAQPPCAFFLYCDARLLAYEPSAVASYYSTVPDAPGVYTLIVVACDASGAVRQSGGSCEVSSGAPEILLLSASRTEVPLGVTIAWTCVARGAKGYGFFVYRDGTLLDLVVAKDGEPNVAEYTPTTPGTYTVEVLATNADGKTKAKGAPVNVAEAKGAPFTIADVSVNLQSAQVGDEIIWTAAVSGGQDRVAFTFFLYRDGALQSFFPTGASGVFRYTATEPGVYSVSVHAQSGLESANGMGADVSVADRPGVRVSGVTASAWKVVLGDKITFTAQVTGAVGEVQYAFALYRDGAFVEWIETGASAAIKYQPGTVGAYSAVAFARDAVRASSASSGETKVVGAELAVDSVTADALSVCVGEPITWTVHTSGAGQLTYMYLLYCGADQVGPAVNASEPTFSCVPDRIGQEYQVVGIVSDGTQTADFASVPVRTFAVGTPHILSITPDKSDIRLGEAVLWTVAVANPQNVEGYRYTLYGNASGIMSETGWLMENTFLIAPTAPDNYALTVELLTDPWGFMNIAAASFSVKRPASLDFAAAQALSDVEVPGLSPHLPSLGATTAPDETTTPVPTLMSGTEFIRPELQLPHATTRPPMAPEKPKPTPTPAPTINPNQLKPPTLHIP